MASTARRLTAAASLLGLLLPPGLSAQETAADGSARVPQRAEPAAVPVPGLLDVQTSNALSPEFIRSVAQVGHPTEVTLDAGQSARSIIEARCGIVSPTYIEEFRSQNSSDGPPLSAEDLEKPFPGRSFVFPYCVKPATVKEAMPDTIGGLYQRMGLMLDLKAIETARMTGSITARPLATLKLFGARVGVGSNSGFVSTELSRKFIRDNPAVDPRSTRPGTPLLATSVQTTATIPLRSGVAPNDVKNNFLVNRVPGTVAGARVAELIGDEGLQPGECQGVVKGEWPFPGATLKNALARILSLRPKGPDRPRDVKVMTVDTGYDPAFGKPAIDSDLFGYLRGPGDAGVMDRVGLNANDEELLDALPPDGLSQRQHGGEVAATILGGTYLQRDPPLITSPRIAFASIAALTASGEPYLDVGGIGEAMLIAGRSDVRIINASVSAVARRESFLHLIAGDEEHLIVAAAGNSRAHPAFDDGDTPWPGSLGGERSNAMSAVVISVGASDPSGDILAFSRYGPQVDLLAPGCRIPTYTLEDGKVVEVERSGTSFAAPLVSLIASQLAWEGLTPAQIKERLIVSAEVDERIFRRTFSGGRLDAPRALSLWRDVMTYERVGEDGKPVLTTVEGILQSNFEKMDLCGQVIEHAKLRSLTLSSMPGAKPASSYWRGWANIQGKLLRLDGCREGEGAITGPALTMMRDDKTVVKVDLTSIRRFTARFM